MARRPVGPLRRLLFSDRSDSDLDTEEEVEEEPESVPTREEIEQELTDEGWVKIEDPFKAENEIEYTIRKWRERINQEGVERKMIHNYMKAYTDLSDEEIEERLDEVF